MSYYIEKKSRLFLPLFVPIPHRQPHILIYRTDREFSIRLKLKRGPERKILFENATRKENRIVLKALRLFAERVFPEPFELIISLEGGAECFSPSITASSVLSAIELGSSIYEESFAGEDIDEILEGIFYRELGFPDGLGYLISKAVRNDASVIGSYGSETAVIDVDPMKVKEGGIIAQIEETPSLDEATSDLVAKLNSHLVTMHYLSIKSADPHGKKLAERGINALLHFLYGIPLPAIGVYSIEAPEGFCSFVLEE